MKIDYRPITESQIYQKDKQRLSKSGSDQSRQIWLLILSIFIPILWPFLIYKIYKFFKVNSENEPPRTEAMMQFCEANGFRMERLKGGFISAEEQQNFTLPPNLPFVAESIFCSRILSGEIEGCPFRYVFAAARIRYKNKTQQYPNNIMIVDLPLDVPKVFINSHSNNLVGLDPRPKNFETAEEHVLEGDFYRYYEVKIEKNDRINMYRTLTPEVMELLKRTHYYDVWINDGQLVIFTFADSEGRYFAAIPELFELTRSLLFTIDTIAREMRQNAYLRANQTS